MPRRTVKLNEDAVCAVIGRTAAKIVAATEALRNTEHERGSNGYIALKKVLWKSLVLNSLSDPVHKDYVRLDDVEASTALPIVVVKPDRVTSLDDWKLQSYRRRIEGTEDAWAAHEKTIAFPKAQFVTLLTIESGEGLLSLRRALDQEEPLFLDGRYLFGDCWWELTGKDRFVAKDDLRFLFLEAVDQERRAMERLKTRFSGTTGNARKREPIPEDARIFVWRRDEGRCVRCGSSENLEFDHIIPFAMGGGNSARNLQLLCEPCNRAKGATL